MSSAGDEAKRLDALQAANLLAIVPEEHYSAIAEVVALLFQTPMAALFLVAGDRAWVKGQRGMVATDSLRPGPLVSEVVRSGSPLVVLDAFAEELLADSVLVTGPPFIRFFVATPVILPGSSLCVGVLCAFDSQPRLMCNAEHIPILDAQARVVAQLIALATQQVRQQQVLQRDLQRLGRDLQCPLLRIADTAGDLHRTFPPATPGHGTEVQQGLRAITLSVECGLAAVQEMAMVSAMRASQLVLRAEPFDLRTCVETVLCITDDHLSAQHLSVGYVLDRDAEVTGDAAQLRRLLVQLMANAMAATTHGSVRLVVQVTECQVVGDAQLRFEVSDTGPGMAADRVQEVLKAGRRHCSSEVTAVPAQGLTTCQMVCEAMGGRLCLESTEGKGTRCHFTVRMPARFPAPLNLGRRVVVVDAATEDSFLVSHCRSLGLSTTHCATLGALRDLCSQLPDAILCDASALPSTVSPVPLPSISVPWLFVGGPCAKLPSPSLRNPVRQTELRTRLLALWQHIPVGCTNVLPSSLSIAIMDPDAISRAVLGGFLKRLGGSADSWLGAADIVAAAQTRSYDVVFLELDNPVVDGWDAAAQLRGLCPPPHVIGIMSDAIPKGETDVKKRCQTAGVADVLYKPLRYGTVCTALQRYHDAGRSTSPWRASSIMQCTSCSSQALDPRRLCSSPTQARRPTCPAPPHPISPFGSPTPSPRNTHIKRSLLSSLAKPLQVDTTPQPLAPIPSSSSVEGEAGGLVLLRGVPQSPTARRGERSLASSQLPPAQSDPNCPASLSPTSSAQRSDGHSSCSESPRYDAADFAEDLPLLRFNSLPRCASGVFNCPSPPRSSRGLMRSLGSMAPTESSTHDLEPLSMSVILEEDLQPLARCHSLRVAHSPRLARRYPSMPASRLMSPHSTLPKSQVPEISPPATVDL